LRKAPCPTTLFPVSETFKDFEATSLFCTRCRVATPVRKKLLLVLSSGNRYDYTCGECGSQVGGKTDNDPTDFDATARAPRRNPPRLG
jgi:hypothetical protein